MHRRLATPRAARRSPLAPRPLAPRRPCPAETASQAFGQKPNPAVPRVDPNSPPPRVPGFIPLPNATLKAVRQQAEGAIKANPVAPPWVFEDETEREGACQIGL